MNNERALALFARCYNRCDFSDFGRKLSDNATFVAFNSFYTYKGQDSIRKALDDKANELRQLELPNKAWRGYLRGHHGMLDLPKMDDCVVLTASDPSIVLGVVMIQCALFRIRDIRVLDPADCSYTRSDLLYGR